MYTSKLIKAGFTAVIASAVMLSTSLFTSCIDDEGIPYPNIQANFATFDVQYESRSSVIDTVNRHVTVFLNDSADIEKVRVLSYTFSRTDAELVDPSVFSSPINLSDTFRVDLKVYREYQWTISAVQQITREFTVEHQIGASVIDETTHTVTASIPSDVDLSAVKVTAIRLAGATAVMTPDLLGKTVDFTSPVKVEVEEHGVKTEWTIIITQTKINISITDIDAWTGVAWVYAAARANDVVTFSYRPTGTLAWIDLPSEDVVADGSVFTARINGLSPETSYEVMASIEGESTQPREFTTSSAVQLPNSQFRDWWLDNKVWCPWIEGGEQYWDTGNKGASTLGESNVVPYPDIDSPTGYGGVLLQTKFIGISIIGKLGAGSIFAGSYVRTDGTNGVLSFGRPFTERPTRVRAHLKYHSAPIDYAISELNSFKGQPDTCIVWCALSDRSEPYEIRTNPKNRQLFDPQDPSVVAYGEFTSGRDIDDFITVDIPLDYRSTSRVPKQILLVAAASKYGDYFTGGAGSVMTLTGYELLYDY